MFVGIGTVVNSAAVVIGGVIGIVFKRALKERMQETMMKAMGLAVIFIGSAGALGRFFEISASENETAHIVLMVVALGLGALLGELINIQDKTEKFGAWLKEKTKSQSDNSFIDGFVYASLTVCIGAMAVIGPIEDALLNNPATLFTKAILDFVIIMVMASSMGKGAVFSALPLAVFQGSVTVLAKVIEPLLSDMAITNISFIGSMLIFCVGVNLFSNKPVVRVANMLPALLFIVLFSFIPL